MSSDDIDITYLQIWLGREEVRKDVITTAPIARLSATLDHPEPRSRVGEPLPECWHWLYFQPDATTEDIAVDGHPQRGGFMPPVSLPRRMWAGSELVFHAPLLVGDEVTRVSVVEAVDLKEGSAGPLVFVTLLHTLYARDQVCVEERQTLVYRSDLILAAPTEKPGVRPSARPQWSRAVTPNPVLLFRYSALTFNAHRIHYDREYATRNEGYAGLVVQGPLTATLLLDLVNTEYPDARLETFRFQGLRPLVDTSPFTLAGSATQEGIKLWAVDASGAIAMKAEARLR
jgi:3-methylfumaryl-CoA hydratase